MSDKLKKIMEELDKGNIDIFTALSRVSESKGIENTGKEIISQDSDLKKFVNYKRVELEKVTKDFEALLRVVEKNNWEIDQEFNLYLMRRKLAEATNISA